MVSFDRQHAFPVKIVDASTSSITNFLSIHVICYRFAIDLAATYNIIQVYCTIPSNHPPLLSATISPMSQALAAIHDFCGLLLLRFIDAWLYICGRRRSRADVGGTRGERSLVRRSVVILARSRRMLRPNCCLIGSRVNPRKPASNTLPGWLTEDDNEEYVRSFARTGFRGSLGTH